MAWDAPCGALLRQTLRSQVMSSPSTDTSIFEISINCPGFQLLENWRGQFHIIYVETLLTVACGKDGFTITKSLIRHAYAGMDKLTAKLSRERRMLASTTAVLCMQTRSNAIIRK